MVGLLGFGHTRYDLESQLFQARSIHLQRPAASRNKNASVTIVVWSWRVTMAVTLNARECIWRGNLGTLYARCDNVHAAVTFVTPRRTRKQRKSPPIFTRQRGQDTFYSLPCHPHVIRTTREKRQKLIVHARHVAKRRGKRRRQVDSAHLRPRRFVSVDF